MTRRARCSFVGVANDDPALLTVAARAALERADLVVCAPSLGSGLSRFAATAPWLVAETGEDAIAAIARAVAEDQCVARLFLRGALADGRMAGERDALERRGVAWEWLSPTSRGEASVGLRPLAGARILVTRARDQAEALDGLLEDHGAEVVDCPTISFVPPSDPERLAAAVARAGQADWLVLTSANGVKSLLAEHRRTRRDVRTLAGVKLAAIGPATAAALAEALLEVELCPDEYRAEALAAELARRGVGGKRVLLLRAEDARDVLPRELAAAGAVVEDVAAYRTVAPPSLGADIAAAVASGDFDFVCFASASTVRNFLGAIAAADRERLFARARPGVIGPVTEEAAVALGLKLPVRAKPYTIPALVDAIRDAWAAAAKGK